MIRTDQFVYGNESCLLSLNYAWYHVLFCLIQFLVLWACSRTNYFYVAHAFGLFALLMDYGVNYLTTGSRTIFYPRLCDNLDAGTENCDEAMGPIGTFLFFVWFDYSAFGILVWALHVEEYTRELLTKGISQSAYKLVRSKVDLFALLIVPIQFWTAPLVAPYVGIDNRTLLLARTSPKSAYGTMVLIFPLLLHFVGGLRFIEEIVPILVSGFCCGLVHHAALFSYGMRRYTDLWGLLLTLCTEWPALIMGIAVVQRLGNIVTTNICIERGHGMKQSSRLPEQPGTRLFTTAMWLGLIAVIYPHISSINDKDAVALLIPHVPGQHMQSIGTAFLKHMTCTLPSYAPPTLLHALTGPSLDCWGGSAANRGEDMLVLASAAKSGAVLSARIVAEVRGVSDIAQISVHIM